MRIASPVINDAFLDQVVASSKSDPSVVRSLRRLPWWTKRQLLGRNPRANRRAARTMWHVYFGLSLLIAATLCLPVNGQIFNPWPVCQPGDVCCPQRQAPQPAVPSARETQRPNLAIVRITSTDGRQIFLGSGTVVGPDRVLTADHVLPPQPTNIEVAFADGQRVNATILARDPGNDLAALAIPTAERLKYRIAEAIPAIGDRTWTAGYGDSSNRFRHVYGPLRHHATAKGGAPGQTLVVAGSARDGDSGGPLINAAGRLVGVISGSDGKVVVGTCCLKIREFLGSIRRPPGGAWPPLPPAPGERGPQGEPGPIAPDTDPLADRLDALEERIMAAVAAIPAGPQGEPGPQGPPGASAEIDMDDLVEKVMDRLPGITFQPVDLDGNPSAEPRTRKLGETIKLKPVPAKRPQLSE